MWVFCGSGNKMEGGEVLKTMECLRRRLLAERQASLLAKEEAELMGKRVFTNAKTIRIFTLIGVRS